MFKKWFKKINYYDLTEEEIQNIYDSYVMDGVYKLDWISVVVFLGEFILMHLDMKSGFFASNNWNYLNFLAEILLIASSLFFFLSCRRAVSTNKVDPIQARKVVIGYKMIVLLSIFLFMFTDIYVRHRMLGAYLVFFFILQLIPFFYHYVNAIMYLVISVIAVTLTVEIGKSSPNTIFSTIMIYFAFYLATNYLRVYYTKQLIYKYRMKTFNEKFQNLSNQAIMALAETVEAKDDYTNGHSNRVAEYSREISRRMGVSEERQQEVYYIGLMHDVGKIGVRDEVINKKGRLTDEEFAEIKKHPVMGYDILKGITELPGIELGARYHHERYDGKGYPDGLSGEDIPLIARVVAVADAYDAMTSNRSYRDIMPQEKVREEIERNKGTQFDPALADIMLSMIDEDKYYLMRELRTVQIVKEDSAV